MGVGVVICLEQGADCLHMVQLMPLHPKKTHHILPHLNPDWFYISADRLTQAVLEKRPLNGCSSNSSSFTVATAPCLIYDCWKIYESFITFSVETFPPRIFREILHIDLNLLATFTLQ